MDRRRSSDRSVGKQVSWCDRLYSAAILPYYRGDVSSSSIALSLDWQQSFRLNPLKFFVRDQPGFLIRYADDFVMGVRDEPDAQRVTEVTPKRFGKFGLTVHSTKTKLVRFLPRGRP